MAAAPPAPRSPSPAPQGPSCRPRVIIRPREAFRGQALPALPAPKIRPGAPSTSGADLVESHLDTPHAARVSASSPGWMRPRKKARRDAREQREQQQWHRQRRALRTEGRLATTREQRASARGAVGLRVRLSPLCSPKKKSGYDLATTCSLQVTCRLLTLRLRVSAPVALQRTGAAAGRRVARGGSEAPCAAALGRGLEPSPVRTVASPDAPLTFVPRSLLLLPRFCYIAKV